MVEIQSLAAKLPSLYEQAVTLSQGQVFREAVAYYTDFLQFTLAEGLSKSEPKILRPMQLLNFVARHGNTSVHFMQAGQEPAQSACETEGKPSACQITTEGDGVTVESQPDADIDWGIEETSISEAAADTGTIDWGEDVAGIVIEGTDGSGIVWSGDATSAAGAAGGIDSGDNAVVAAATPSGACSGSGITSSILEHSPTRNEYVDQLLEVRMLSVGTRSMACLSSLLSVFPRAKPFSFSLHAPILFVPFSVHSSKVFLHSDLSSARETAMWY